MIAAALQREGYYVMGGEYIWKQAIIAKMLAMFPAGSEIWVTTFREGDPRGDAPRALYKKLGFAEDELVMEFGYPSQKFVLQKK